MSRKRLKKTPLGGAVWEARDPRRAWDVFRRFFGDSELGERVAKAMRWARVDGRGIALTEPRRGTGPIQAGILRTALALLSDVDVHSREARGRRLWTGEADRLRPLLKGDGSKALGPDGEPRFAQRYGRRGLAAHVGVSPKTVQRYLAALAWAGVLTRRQNGRVSRAFRGWRFAFNTYRFLEAIPRAVVLKLREWRGEASREAPERERRGRPRPPESRQSVFDDLARSGLALAQPPP